VAYYIPVKSGTTAYTRITTFLTICSGPAIYHWHSAAGYSKFNVKNRVHCLIKFVLNWKVCKTKQSNRAISEHRHSVCLRGLGQKLRQKKIAGIWAEILNRDFVSWGQNVRSWSTLFSPPRPFPVKMTRKSLDEWQTLAARVAFLFLLTSLTTVPRPKLWYSLLGKSVTFTYFPVRSRPTRIHDGVRKKNKQ